MKKIISLLAVLAILLTCSAASADLASAKTADGKTERNIQFQVTGDNPWPTDGTSPTTGRSLDQLAADYFEDGIGGMVVTGEYYPIMEEAARFFMVAQAAYENGDLQVLRSVAVATEDMGGNYDDAGLSEDEAAAELELVLAHERVTAQQLEELKRANPYALGERLEDAEWVIRRTSGLKGQIEEQKAAARAYDERFRTLAGGAGGGR